MKIQNIIEKKIVIAEKRILEDFHAMAQWRNDCNGRKV